MNFQNNIIIDFDNRSLKIILGFSFYIRIFSYIFAKGLQMFHLNKIGI